LHDHAAREPVGAGQRAVLEARGREATDPSCFAALWDEHRERIAGWHAAAERLGRPARRGPFAWFWRRQSRLDALA
jgi:hypothetical protein